MAQVLGTLHTWEGQKKLRFLSLAWPSVDHCGHLRTEPAHEDLSPSSVPPLSINLPSKKDIKHFMGRRGGRKISCEGMLTRVESLCGLRMTERPLGWTKPWAAAVTHHAGQLYRPQFMFSLQGEHESEMASFPASHES